MSKEVRKVFNFDVETTGLFPNTNGIIQLSGIIEIGDKEVDEFDFKMRPYPDDEIEDEALAVTGHSREEIKNWQDPTEVYHQLIEIMGKYVDPYDPSDKFYPCGYNINFDTSFLIQFFKKNKDQYIGSWLKLTAQIDPLYILRMLDFMGKIWMDNYRLETVAEALNIEINPHDALSDIKATMQIRKIVESLIDC